jgi:hypothetical protein
MTTTVIIKQAYPPGCTDCPGLKDTEKATGNTKRSRAIRAFISTNKPAIGQLIQGMFDIRTLEEAEKLSTMLASHCPSPDTAAVGIWELLSNAIEHGSLEIDRNLKCTLLLRGDYLSELERRFAAYPYSSRHVRVIFRRNSTSIRLRVIDEGPGFDFAKILEEKSLDEPASLTAPNGRGLALARLTTFHALAFRGKGNIVDGTIRF